MTEPLGALRVHGHHVVNLARSYILRRGFACWLLGAHEPSPYTSPRYCCRCWQRIR